MLVLYVCTEKKIKSKGGDTVLRVVKFYKRLNGLCFLLVVKQGTAPPRRKLSFWVSVWADMKASLSLQFFLLC